MGRRRPSSRPGRSASSSSRARELGAPRTSSPRASPAQIFDTAIVTGYVLVFSFEVGPAGPADPLHRPRGGLRPLRDPGRARRSRRSRRRSSPCFEKLRADQLHIAFSWKLVELPDRLRGDDGADRRLARRGWPRGRRGRPGRGRAPDEAERRLHEPRVERGRWPSCAASRALRADFVSLVSHEVRTPMAAVIGSAQTLQQRWRELARRPARRLPGADRRRDRPAGGARRRGARQLADRRRGRSATRFGELDLGRAGHRDGRRGRARPRRRSASPPRCRPTCPASAATRSACARC